MISATWEHDSNARLYRLRIDGRTRGAIIPDAEAGSTLLVASDQWGRETHATLTAPTFDLGEAQRIVRDMLEATGLKFTLEE